MSCCFGGNSAVEDGSSEAGPGPMLLGSTRPEEDLLAKAAKFDDASSMNLTLKDIDKGKTLGMGAFGRVHIAKVKGQHAEKCGPCALKIMQKARIIKEKQVDHVKGEVLVMKALSHPFLVNMLASFSDDTCIYVLMEFICGGELYTHLRNAETFDDPTASFYAAGVTIAFEYLHSLHIAYRDLKPENILLDNKGHVKVADFGFAKVIEDKTYTFCGTPEYFAPEIIQSKGHGVAVDWWALGILTFEMLAGYPPFSADTPFRTYELVVACKIVFPYHFEGASKDLIKRLVTPDLAKRFGCLKNGVSDIKRHKWHKETDWGAMMDRTVPAPIVPATKGAGDTSQFEAYEEVTEAIPKISAEEQKLFEGL